MLTKDSRKLVPVRLAALFVLLCSTPCGLAQEKKEEGDASKADETELTLENLFPEKGLFGPSVRSVGFSFDGRYAAWLYRPYLERRHGSDLWLHDFQTGWTSRVTSVSVMAPFQAETRKVLEDRAEKAEKRAKKKEDKDEKAAGAGGADGGSSKDSQSKAGELGDTVGDDDADDEDAPRYSGVSSFEWSPTANELLFTSSGDIYRLVSGQEGIERLTKTRESERDVQYLPDGSGYTYQLGDALLRVAFGAHLMEQLDPKLPSGLRMRGYELSPDGRKVVFLASSGERSSDSGRKVNIATYRDRFMQVREVPRTVSDDPLKPTETAIYLYALPDAELENGTLVKVYSRQRSGPRDVLRVPSWAPDSSRVAFSVFEQSSGHVNVLEADLPPEEEEAEEAEEAEAKKPGAGEKDQAKKEEKEKNEEKEEKGKKRSDDTLERDARVVYRFLHNGGPTTPRMIDPEYLADSRRMILMTEQAGFRHLYVLDPVYESLEQLTRGHHEVYPLDMPEHREFMFVSATQEDPSCLDVYRLDLGDGSLTRLTPQTGRYENVAVSPDGKHLLGTYAAYGTLPELVHVDVEKNEQKALTDSHPDKLRAFTQAVPEPFTYENRHGQRIHGHLFKPPGWKKDVGAPLLIYVYGGPLGTRKQVTQGNYGSDAYFFAWYMAQKHGYVTCTIDPRGMSGYGALFEKANYQQVGTPQVEDLVDGVTYLIENYGVDAERVGMHGWSFGGFQTQMCMYTEPKVFAAGIAGAGPTEWENYNAWYSTGTIGPSREGETDLEKYSLLPLAKNLEGKLLLVHGMEDSNVLYQDTVRVYAELLDAGKETLVELFLDPTGGHGLGGHIKRLNRYRKYEEFLVRTLGEGTVVEPTQ